MNDISLCSGIACPIKDKWMRFILTKNLKSNKYVWWIDPAYDGEKCKLLIQQQVNR